MGNSETVTLGMQTSGEDNQTGKHVMELRRLLAQYCRGPYCAEIEEFALILRIGGSMQDFDFEGCERIRRSRKDKYITVDIGFPAHRWKGASDAQIREYLAVAVEAGLLCCLSRLEKDRTQVDSSKLLADLAQAKNAFLSRKPGSTT